MPSVQELLASKGSKVCTIGKEATVLQAVKLMVEHKIGALIVTDQGKIAGIFTERDVMHRVVAPERAPASTRVAEVMTEGVATGSVSTSIDEARSIMVNRRLRHLPIVDDKGALLGIVSITDLNAYLVGKK